MQLQTMDAFEIGQVLTSFNKDTRYMFCTYSDVHLHL